jgi:lipopolysaccharide cholinephosphotransferase
MKEFKTEYRAQQEQEWAPFDHEKGFKLLIKVVSILDSAGIPYHLEGGTLLGLVRDGQLLSWDDDMDISIPSEYIDKAAWALTRLMISGWRVDRRRWKLFKEYGFEGTRIAKIRDRSRGLLKTGRVYMDIISKVKQEGFCYWEAKERLMRVDSKYYEGFDVISVNGYEFKTPKYYKDYLTEKYGDWAVPVKEWDCGVDEGTIVK